MDTSSGLGAAPTGRQQLASALRQLRDLAGVSGRELAQRIGISQSKVSRIESAIVVPSLPEVTAWAETLGASPEAHGRLRALVEAAFNEVHPWRAALQRGNLQDRIRDLESTATRMRTFQPFVVPGLLQTAEYARQVISMFYRQYSDSDPAAEVASRLHRQLALYEPNQRFEFLISESALRWFPGSLRLQLAQLDRIASISTLENVSVGLVPFAVEAVTLITHNFVIYDEDDADDAIVTVETIHADMTVDEPEHVEIYRSRWSSLQQMALYADGAREFLGRIANDLRNQNARSNHDE